MSDTPRTDAEEIGYRDKQRVPADFARQLERELNAANVHIVELEGELKDLEAQLGMFRMGFTQQQD